jgi:hypothetical protein
MSVQNLAAAEETEIAGTAESFEGQTKGGQRLGLDAASAVSSLEYLLGRIVVKSR